MIGCCLADDSGCDGSRSCVVARCCRSICQERSALYSLVVVSFTFVVHASVLGQAAPFRRSLPTCESSLRTLCNPLQLSVCYCLHCFSFPSSLFHVCSAEVKTNDTGNPSTDPLRALADTIMQKIPLVVEVHQADQIGALLKLQQVTRSIDRCVC